MEREREESLWLCLAAAAAPFGTPLTVHCLRIMQVLKRWWWWSLPPLSLSDCLIPFSVAQVPALCLACLPACLPAPVMSNKRINLFFGGSQCWTFSWKMLVISGWRQGPPTTMSLFCSRPLQLLFLHASAAAPLAELHCEFIDGGLWVAFVNEVVCKFHFNSISGLDYNPPRAV